MAQPLMWDYEGTEHCIYMTFVSSYSDWMCFFFVFVFLHWKNQGQRNGRNARLWDTNFFQFEHCTCRLLFDSWGAVKDERRHKHNGQTMVFIHIKTMEKQHSGKQKPVTTVFCLIFHVCMMVTDWKVLVFFFNKTFNANCLIFNWIELDWAQQEFGFEIHEFVRTEKNSALN